MNKLYFLVINIVVECSGLLDRAHRGLIVLCMQLDGEVVLPTQWKQY